MKLNEDFGQLFEVDKDEDIVTGEAIPVFTFTPDRSEFQHWHIELARKKAEELYKFLGDILKKE